MVVMGIFVFFLVPETKGQPLEKMDEIFGSPYGMAEPQHLQLTARVNV